MKTSDFLLTAHPILSRLGTVALISLIITLAISGPYSLLVAKDGPAVHYILEGVLVVSMGMVMIPALLTMFGVTYFVIKERCRLDDWGLYLTVVWVIPYISVAVMLGGANLIRWRKGRAGRASANAG